MNNMTKEIKKKEVTLADLAGGIDNLAGNFNHLTGKMESLDKKMGSLDKKVVGLEKKIDGLVENVDGLTKNLDTLASLAKKEFEGLDKILEINSSDLTQLKSGNVEIRANLGSLFVVDHKHTTDISNLKIRVKRLEKEEGILT